MVPFISRSKTSRSYKDNNYISYHCPSYIYFSYQYTEKGIYLYKESLKYGFLLKCLNFLAHNDINHDCIILFALLD